MTYAAEISRTNPSCFVFMIDQSASMIDPIGGSGLQHKHEVVADALTRLLMELSIKCAKEEGVRDYFHVAVIGYGGSTAGPALGGDLRGQDRVSIGLLSDSPLSVKNRTLKV